MSNITDREIREYLGHNGIECRIRVTRDGRVMQFGNRDPFNREFDYWAFVSTRADIAAEIEANRTN